MKKLLALSLLAVMVLACSDKKGTAKGSADEEEKVIELVTKEFSKSHEGPHTSAQYKIDFPVGGDENLRKVIFDFLYSMMEDYVGNVEEASKLSNDGQAFVDAYCNLSAEHLKNGWDCYSQGEEMDEVLDENATARLIVNEKKYVTYTFDYDCYFGGDGYSANRGATFLKADGRQLDGKWLFSKSQSPKLLKLVHKALKKEYAGNEGFLDPAFIDEMADLPEEFFITKDGIRFVYTQATAAWFLLNGIIPMEEAQDVLSDQASELLEE